MTNKNLVLTAMIFAVAMLFIDQTIVALAVPNLQRHLHLSSSGSQWVVNGYLLALSALFALGGKIADVFGPRRMVTIGVIAFALCSAACGATPTGPIAETWLIVFRVLPGRLRGGPVPGGPGDRHRQLSGRRTRQGAGGLILDQRRG